MRSVDRSSKLLAVRNESELSLTVSQALLPARSSGCDGLTDCLAEGRGEAARSAAGDLGSSPTQPPVVATVDIP